MTYTRRLAQFTEALLHEIEAERLELRKYLEAAEHEDLIDGYSEQIQTLDEEHGRLRDVLVTLYVTNGRKSLQRNAID